MRLNEALEQFKVDYVAMKGLSAATEENYCLAVLSFTRAVGDIDVATITPKHLLEWRKWMEQRNKRSTIRGYLSKLKNLLQFTNKRGWSQFDVSELYLPKLSPPLPEYLLPEEVDHMITSSDTVRNKLIIAMMFSSGMRAGELGRLDKADIVDHQIFIRQGKGNTSRMVFIDTRTRTLLDQYFSERGDNRPIVFQSYKNGRLQVGSINKIVKLAAQSAHINRPVHSHMLRHSFATTLVRSGVDISYVQRMMGHAFVNTTQIYVHLTNNDLQGAHNKVFN